MGERQVRVPEADGCTLFPVMNIPRGTLPKVVVDVLCRPPYHMCASVLWWLKLQARDQTVRRSEG